MRFFQTLVVATVFVLFWVNPLQAQPSPTWSPLVQDAELLFQESPVAITGASIGDGGEPGAFFIFSRLLIENGKSSDFVTLIRHPNPALRALSVVGLVWLKEHNASDLETILQPILNDTTPVQVTDAGCVGEVKSLGDWAKNFLTHPESLGHDNAESPDPDSFSYDLAREFYSKGQWQLDRGQIEMAQKLAEAGLRRLGRHYASPQTIDDTGQKLLAAKTLIEQGQKRDGVALELKMLQVRLELFLKKSS